MGVLQLRCDSDLALEALYGDLTGHVARHDLDDDSPAERLLRGEEDTRHSAATELALEGVADSQRILELFAQVSSHSTPEESRGKCT